jgi:hypothetical protein
VKIKKLTVASILLVLALFSSAAISFAASDADDHEYHTGGYGTITLGKDCTTKRKARVTVDYGKASKVQFDKMAGAVGVKEIIKKDDGGRIRREGPLESCEIHMTLEDGYPDFVICETVTAEDGTQLPPMTYYPDNSSWQWNNSCDAPADAGVQVAPVIPAMIAPETDPCYRVSALHTTDEWTLSLNTFVASKESILQLFDVGRDNHVVVSETHGLHYESRKEQMGYGFSEVRAFDIKFDRSRSKQDSVQNPDQEMLQGLKKLEDISGVKLECTLLAAPVPSQEK